MTRLRLKERNKCIPRYTEEEIAKRCEVVGRANGKIIIPTKGNADMVGPAHLARWRYTPSGLAPLQKHRSGT